MTWTLRGRSSNLTLGTVYSDWTGQLVERLNMPDTLQVTGRTDHLRTILTPGGGCNLEDDNGVRFSGPLTEYTKRGDGTCTATFTSDLIWLWDRICYPNPAVTWENQPTDFAVKDVRSGAAETVMLSFINANVGPGAITGRAKTGLTVPTSLGRGPTVTITARFDNLGQLVADICRAAKFRTRVLQSGSALNVTVDSMADLSAWARYGTQDAGGPGVLSEGWEYTIKAPELTRAMVGGGGEGAARVLRERADTTGVATLWGALRREVFIDQRNTTDTTELDRAGDDALDEAVQPVSIKATIPDVPGVRLVTDVPIGSVVALDLDGDLVLDRLQQVTTEISEGGDKSEGVVGSADAGLTRDQKKFLKLHKALRKVQAQ